MAEPLRINGTEIPLGARVTIDLPLPNLYTHTRMQMPVRILRGRQSGPTLLVNAAIHGDEINGVEIIRRLLAMPIMKRLRGTVLAVPVVNVFGFIAHTRYLPDRRDLNRCFPGFDKGSLGSRLANLFLDEIFAKASHCIDLHTGARHRANLPQIRTDMNISENQTMAKAFGVPVILDSNTPPDGTLRKVAMDRGTPLIVYEGGEALRFDELSIRAGVRGVMSVMRFLKMLPAVKPGKLHRESVIARSSRWMRAPQSGIMRAAKSLGTQVEQGEPLAWVSDPFGEQESPVPSRISGIIIGKTNLPLVNEGEALFHVAEVQKPGALEAQLETYHESLAEMPELADPSD